MTLSPGDVTLSPGIGGGVPGWVWSMTSCLVAVVGGGAPGWVGSGLYDPLAEKPGQFELQKGNNDYYDLIKKWGLPLSFGTLSQHKSLKEDSLSTRDIPLGPFFLQYQYIPNL